MVLFGAAKCPRHAIMAYSSFPQTKGHVGIAAAARFRARDTGQLLIIYGIADRLHPPRLAWLPHKKPKAAPAACPCGDVPKREAYQARRTTKPSPASRYDLPGCETSPTQIISVPGKAFSPIIHAQSLRKRSPAALSTSRSEAKLRPSLSREPFDRRRPEVCHAD